MYTSSGKIGYISPIELNFPSVKGGIIGMGILNYTNDKGELKEHTPDDTRHTFTTMWKEKKLDEAMRRKIQGHSGKGIGEMVYTHFEFEQLCNELNKL